MLLAVLAVVSALGVVISGACVVLLAVVLAVVGGAWEVLLLVVPVVLGVWAVVVVTGGSPGGEVGGAQNPQDRGQVLRMNSSFISHSPNLAQMTHSPSVCTHSSAGVDGVGVMASVAAVNVNHVTQNTK